MTMVHEEDLAQRAEGLLALGFNGIDRVLVELVPTAAPERAVLEIHFHNDLHVAAIVAAAGDLRTRFPITGGRRIRGGSATGEVQVVAASAGTTSNTIQLLVEPIGDYSTYRLGIVHANIDPIFAEIPFRFRPGCFTTDCTPRKRGGPRVTAAEIDYTAKDYESFRHTLVAAMNRRLPGWAPTSEADLTQLLIDYLAAAADGLSDYQDRVVNERALGTARKRVSLARHARLVDYYIHEGNQAKTWLAVDVGAGVTSLVLPAGLLASTAGGEPFESASSRSAYGALDAADLYTWSGVRPGLDVGATSADLVMSAAHAAIVATAINDGTVGELVIWEARDPATGRAELRDPHKRQLLRLVPRATAGVDPITGASYLRVVWRDDDALRAAYCASLRTPEGVAVTDAVKLSGNLLEVRHGRSRTVTFVTPVEAAHATHAWQDTRWGAICELPDNAALLYRDTPPGDPPIPSTFVEVIVGSDRTEWDYASSLVHARPEFTWYTVETDELGRSLLRFGNGDNGAELPSNAHVRVTWQSGAPLAGNVGVDAIVRCDDSDVLRCWNPFDVTNARSPEPREQILRRAPEMYRTRQLRWVSLADVVARAEEVPGVARAAARYVWTGSWTAIRLAIDPSESDELDDELRTLVADHLAPLALIGDDLEIRAARYVPLHIVVVVCISQEAWREHVRADIEDELSDGHTADGRRGLFHPDEWTFGQSLYASQILGRVQAVPGVEHVVSIDLERYREPTTGFQDRIEVAPHEIIQVRNDPSDMERGLIEIELTGGRG